MCSAVLLRWLQNGTCDNYRGRRSRIAVAVLAWGLNCGRFLYVVVIAVNIYIPTYITSQSPAAAALRVGRNFTNSV